MRVHCCAASYFLLHQWKWNAWKTPASFFFTLRQQIMAHTHTISSLLPLLCHSMPCQTETERVHETMSNTWCLNDCLSWFYNEWIIWNVLLLCGRATQPKRLKIIEPLYKAKCKFKWQNEMEHLMETRTEINYVVETWKTIRIFQCQTLGYVYGWSCVFLQSHLNAGTLFAMCFVHYYLAFFCWFYLFEF